MALAEWTVLVLLSQHPAHGFAVSQLTAPDGELGRIWRIPRPVVYRAIGRLIDAGLITPESVEPGLGPQRTIYTVTEPGRLAAENWLNTPVEHVRDMRSQLLVKLALRYRAGGDPAELLARQRAALEPIAQAMQAQQAGLDGFDAILTAWRRATAAAALGFLDEISPKAPAVIEPRDPGCSQWRSLGQHGMAGRSIVASYLRHARDRSASHVDGQALSDTVVRSRRHVSNLILDHAEQPPMV